MVLRWIPVDCSGACIFFVDSRNILYYSGWGIVGHTPQISHRGHMVKSWLSLSLYALILIIGQLTH